MSNIIRSNFQDHPFHLVSPSPWPLYTSLSLLILTTTTALSMHNFYNSYYLFYLGVESFRKSLMCLELSNSGDTLKLLVPSSSQNTAACGWISYSCKAISKKMIEREVGNHGSKSITCLPVIVKEQRVDGNWQDCLTVSCLRFTLTGFERNFQKRILSNPINRQTKRWCTSRLVQSQYEDENFILNPYFVTGFSDGKGCFFIHISKDNRWPNSWNVRLNFKIRSFSLRSPSKRSSSFK